LSTFEDVYALVRFLHDTYVDKDPPDVDAVYGLLQAGGGSGSAVLGGAGSRAYSNMTVQEYWNTKCGA
jgi:hypothetical protein